jgi:catechol 2,3-dioxygenase-like lactoylglutathione lyase family enzyme
MSKLSFFQIALNSVDLAATLRLYSEVFGFSNAGAQVGWGESLVIQGLEPTGQALVWWMIGRNPRTQFEIFHHTGPKLRSLPEDWSPADHGWVRFGIAVSDIDDVRNKLAERGIEAIAGAGTRWGLQHFAIRDPHCGIVIEIWQDGPELPGRLDRKQGDPDPIILYATTSVPDIAAARRFYGEIVGMPILPLDTLHTESDEALWGLADAQREGFVVDGEHGMIEVVKYRSPTATPRDDSYRLSDQGIMNIGFFSRDNAPVRAVVERLDAELRPPRFLTTGAGVLGIYLNQPAREIELLSCPAEVEPYIGFANQGPFNASDHIKMMPYSRALLDSIS